MSFFKKSLNTVERLDPVSIGNEALVPVSIEAEMKQEERKAYAELCRQIEFSPAAIIKDEILAFLVDRGFKVYSYGSVKTYLDCLFGKRNNPRGQTWSWCPLRVKDQGKSDLARRTNNEVFPWNQDNGKFELDRTYHGAVPFAVLDLVKGLDRSSPGLLFFVSDVMQPQDRKGDPFLAVTTPGLAEMIVIAVWDEPNFGF